MKAVASPRISPAAAMRRIHGAGIKPKAVATKMVTASAGDFIWQRDFTLPSSTCVIEWTADVMLVVDGQKTFFKGVRLTLEVGAVPSEKLHQLFAEHRTVSYIDAIYLKLGTIERGARSLGLDKRERYEIVEDFLANAKDLGIDTVQPSKALKMMHSVGLFLGLSQGVLAEYLTLLDVVNAPAIMADDEYDFEPV